MLDTLDTLIGFVVVMLVVSMAVTMLTGAINNLFNVRGLALRQGIARLLILLDRGVNPKDAKRIADHILRDPLIAAPKLGRGTSRLASTVHREELTKLILAFAANVDEVKAPTWAQKLWQTLAFWKKWSSAPTRSELKDVLRKSLRDNGIKKPAEVLKQVRMAALKLEQASPDLSGSMRQNLALLTVAESHFLGKINGWFDQTIDRVSDAFTARTRLVTAFTALLVALTLQLDAIAVLNRVHTDPAVRADLVRFAIQHPELLKPEETPAPASEDDKQKPSPLIDSLNKAASDPAFKHLVDQDLIELPASAEQWWGRLTDKNSGLRIIGILLSALLLSLGAPFWYSALQNLLKLRSVIGARDDAERQKRQTQQEDVQTPGKAAIPPEFEGGEKGDPEAVG